MGRSTTGLPPPASEAVKKGLTQEVSVIIVFANTPATRLGSDQGSAQADVQKAGFSRLEFVMSKVAFTKEASTPAQLLQKWVSRGLVVAPGTEQAALNYLTYVGAYRLKGYWHHEVHPSTKHFPPGRRFEDIVHRYEMDRELRALTATAVERLEVAVRAVMANYLSVRHGPHWFLQQSIFKPNRDWGMGHLIRKIEDEVHRSKGRRFVEHYFKNHDDPYLPPSWSVSECVTFGLWSRTFAILRDPNDRKAISKRFNVDTTEVFESWLHTLTVMRNIVAHNGQIYRTKIHVSPSNYKAKQLTFSDKQSFYATATVIHYMLHHAGLPNTWKADIAALFSKHQASVKLQDFGFQPSWPSAAGW